MKPVDFAYRRPASVSEALSLLAGSGGATKIMAGGQTLGPMLNLRFVQPDLVLDISRIPELQRVEETADAIVLGACITHAAIEDGRVPDAARGMLARVAARIAYRAVRTRGTIGGSLAHADPAADWVSSLTALGASVSVKGGSSSREVRLDDFVTGALSTVLGDAEIIDAVRVPRLTAGARWGYHKICRKTGEFAEAIGAVVIDRERCRIVAGATSGRAIVLDIPASDALARHPTAADIAVRLKAAGLSAEPYEMNIHAAAVRRAIEEANTT